MRDHRGLAPAALAFALSACGGAAHGAPTAVTPPDDKAAAPSMEEESPAASASEGSSGNEAAGRAGTESDGAPPGAADSTPAPTPKDVLLKPDVLYVFSFTSSEPHQVAEKHCKQASHDDPKRMAQCMSAASKRVDRDAMSFQQGSDGKYWWLTVRRKGASLVTLHRIAFDFGKESGSKISLELHGPDKGRKPFSAVPKRLVVEIEGGSDISVDDPKLGHLVYEAKLGLLGNK